MYIALVVGLLTMLAGAAFLLQIGWTRLVLASADKYLYLSLPAGSTLAGALLWGFHAGAIAVIHQTNDRHSTLRALEGFIAVAISIATALFGATQILSYALARVMGVSDPGGAGTNLLAALATPGSLLLVHGVAWFLVRRGLARDAGTQEADRQAGVRRLYTNLAALISLAAMGYGAASLLATLSEQLEAPIIGVKAPDWKDPVSLSVTLLVVGAAVWIAHWRQAPWAADRQSLSRKLYVWAALLGSILAVLGGGVRLLNAPLPELFSSPPLPVATTNPDFCPHPGAAPQPYLDLVDWRRRVGALYRISGPDALARFRDARNELFRTHPQSPIEPDQRSTFTGLRYFDADPAYRVTARVEPGDGSELAIDTGGDDGAIRYRRGGQPGFWLGGR